MLFDYGDTGLRYQSKISFSFNGQKTCTANSLKIEQGQLKVSWCSQVVCIRLYLMKQPHAGQNWFSYKRNEKGEVVGYWFGTLAYAAGNHGGETMTDIGNGPMQIALQSFTMWAVPVEEQGRDCNDVIQRLWIVPNAFCCIPFVNDYK